MTKNILFDQLQLAQALKAHWPSERCQHEAIAANYFKLVKQALIRGIHMANEEQIKLQLIPVAMDQIRLKLGRYGPKGQQKYWFDWIQENYPLMTKVQQGYKIGNKGILTMVKTTRDIDLILSIGDPSEVFKAYYQDEVNSQMDWVKIDLDSLDAYIRHNLDSQKYVSANAQHKKTLEDNYRSAKLIFDVASYAKGELPQIVSASDFGRKYYRGINLQSAAKIVRHAALGSCYQYDIEASVFVWKMDTAKEINPAVKLPATIDYLDFKQHHRQRLAELLFNNQSEHTISLIKRVITAVGFGARTTNTVWRMSNGQWKTTAVKEIIRSNELVKQLFDDSWFKEFVQEQDQVNKLIFDHVKDVEQIRNLSFLKSERGLLSKNKTISYLYQQQESRIIQALEKRLHQANNQILLVAHDGFYTKNRADITDLRYELQQYLPNARLDEIRHTAFKYAPDSVIDDKQHKAWIRQEESKIAELFGKSVHKPTTIKVTHEQRNDEFDIGHDDGTRAYEHEEEQLPEFIQQLLYK